MFYHDEKGRLQCTKCCVSCDEDRKSCEAYKERGRAVRREIYALRKKQEREKCAK